MIQGNIRTGLAVVSLPALAILGAGCENVRHDFLPLEVGNTWLYRVRSGGREMRPERVRVTGEIEPVTREARGTPRLRGRTARRFRVEEPGGAAVWSKDRGTVVRASLAEATTVLQHPPFVGTGWTDRRRDGRAIYCRVIAREAVEVPAGGFADCVVVRREAEDRSSTVTQWFAPGVGIVKWRLAPTAVGDPTAVGEREGGAAVEWELEKYELVTPRPGGTE